MLVGRNGAVERHMIACLVSLFYCMAGFTLDQNFVSHPGTRAYIASCAFNIEHTPFMIPEKISGEHTITFVFVRLVFPSVRPSPYLLNLSTEIDVANNKCSFRLGLEDQGHSRSFWKVQGHSESEAHNTNIQF